MVILLDTKDYPYTARLFPDNGREVALFLLGRDLQRYSIIVGGKMLIPSSADIAIIEKEVKEWKP
jgi:hypothetical protein